MYYVCHRKTQLTGFGARHSQQLLLVCDQRHLAVVASRTHPLHILSTTHTSSLLQNT